LTSFGPKIGDIVGSVHERRNIKTKDEPPLEVLLAAEGRDA
jgi:hypothetical protein